MLNGVLTTTVNHTAAEAFLRGAAPGERSTEDESGYTWTLIDHGDGSWNFYSNLGFYIALPPGQYTLQYRKGMTLTAAEAWDYLAADEARRCRSRFKRVLYRVSGGALQSCDNYPGAAWQGYSQAQTALPGADPYTVAPDALGEARTGVTAERLARRYVEAFDFGILDDADKLAEWAVDARDALFMAHGELAAERKRVAELEAENDAIRKRWEETANERDAPERYQDAIDYLASELDIIGTPDEIATEARNTIEALRAAAVTLPDDTTTPLTLTQRAMALEMGRWVTIGKGKEDGHGPIRVDDDDFIERSIDGQEYGVPPEAIFALGAVVTLCPESAPNRAEGTST